MTVQTDAKIATLSNLTGTIVGLGGLAVIFASAVAWGFGLQADVRATSQAVAELAEKIDSLDFLVRDLREDRWTRSDHRDFAKDVELRLRALETKK